MIATSANARRSYLGAALCLLFGAALSVVVLWSPSGAQDVDLGNQYIDRARTAALSTDFSGTVEVQWLEPGGYEKRRVNVRSEDGVLSVGGSNGIVVQGPARFAKLTDGWATMWAESPKQPVRAASDKWDLSVRGGPLIAGRATCEVDATERASGQIRERRYFDAVTGILLHREQYDDAGIRVRSSSFVNITLPPQAGAGAAPKVPSQTHLHQPEAIDRIPPGFDVPTGVGNSFRLNGAYRENDGTVQLFYSDGLFSASVFQQPGSLDRGDLEPGGVDHVVAGKRVQQYDEPMGTVLVWEGDGVVYTSVSDAPEDELPAIVASFDASPGFLHEALDYVLGPFFW